MTATTRSAPPESRTRVARSAPTVNNQTKTSAVESTITKRGRLAGKNTWEVAAAPSAASAVPVALTNTRVIDAVCGGASNIATTSTHSRASSA